jgi:hypothetical protein
MQIKETEIFQQQKEIKKSSKINPSLLDQRVTIL